MSSPASTSPAATVFPITRLGAALNYFLAILLSTALVTALVFVIYVISPRPVLLLVPPVCFLVIIEATLTTRWLAADEQRQVNRFLYRGAELVFIFAVLRLLTWLLDGRLPDLVTLREYILAPLSFFDSRYMGFLFFAIIAWDRAITFSAILTRLSLTDDEIAFYSLPAYRRSLRADDRPFDAQRSGYFTSLINNWVLGGIVLALCAAVTTFQLPAADSANVFQLRNLGRIGLRPEMLVLLLTYFLGGLWLIGRMRLVMMRARWVIDGIQGSPVCSAPGTGLRCCSSCLSPWWLLSCRLAPPLPLPVSLARWRAFCCCW